MPKTVFDKLKLTEGCDYNVQLKAAYPEMKPAVIVVQESLTPHYEGQAPKINVKTNQVVKSATGQSIYYKTAVLDEGAEDVIIPTSTSTASVANAQAVVEEMAK